MSIFTEPGEVREHCFYCGALILGGTEHVEDHEGRCTQREHEHDFSESEVGCEPLCGICYKTQNEINKEK